MSIPEGLFVTPDFVTEAEEQQLITWLDTQTWGTDLSRRTQHYGYKYNYSGGALQPAPVMTGPILSLAAKIATMGYPMEQCIVNEYFRDQGIAPHIDRNLFGPIIIGISLGADCIMHFEREPRVSGMTNDRVLSEYDCFLPRRSLLMLSGPARTEWKHSISKNVSFVDAAGIKRKKPDNYRRISCTYRTLARQ